MVGDRRQLQGDGTGTGGTALVTGANGHLGYNLARQLRDAGWQVRCSVRDPSDPSRTAHLRAAGLDDLVRLDVRDGKSFVAAAAGMDVIFHVAATYRYWTEGAEADAGMIRDSREGAANAVQAAAASGARRLVLTSSIVAVPLSDRRDETKDETDWQQDFRLPYFRAKTEAERDAWQLAERSGVDMVAVLPGAIIGPGFQRRTTSTDIIENIMLGSFRMGRPNSNFPTVDVRDAARAHVMVASRPCEGRFIACNDRLPDFGELVEAMRAVDPRVPRSLMVMPDAMLSMLPFFDRLSAKLMKTRRLASPEFASAIRGKWWNFSNARARKELGWEPEIPLSDSLLATMTRIREIWKAEGMRA